MACPKCGTERVMHVSIRLRCPEEYRSLLSKSVVRKKECQITAAFWDGATLTCPKCGCRERGL
jgi:hypothetical protein